MRSGRSRGLLRAAGSFYAAGDEKALERLAWDIFGKSSLDERELFRLERRIERALVSYDECDLGSGETVFFSGKAYKARLTLRSVMRAAALSEQRFLPERKRVMLGLKGQLAPLSFARAVFLTEEKRRQLLDRLSEIADAGGLCESFSALYKTFAEKGIDLSKETVGWRKFKALIGTEEFAAQPFEQGVSRIFDRLLTQEERYG